MTESQVREQMKRLSIFGNLQDEVQFQEYFKALQGHGYTELYNTIEWLVTNYDRRGLPLPAEIIRIIKQQAFDKSQQKEKGKWSECGTVESNAEFWRAWHMVELLDSKRWGYYYFERLGKNTPMVEGKVACEYYRGIQNEIKNELSGNRVEEIVPEEALVTPIEGDLPF